MAMDMPQNEADENGNWATADAAVLSVSLLTSLYFQITVGLDMRMARGGCLRDSSQSDHKPIRRANNGSAILLDEAGRPVRK